MNPLRAVQQFFFGSPVLTRWQTGKEVLVVGSGTGVVVEFNQGKGEVRVVLDDTQEREWFDESRVVAL